MEAPALGRNGLLTLFDKALCADAVTDAPQEAERGDRLYGSAGSRVIVEAKAS